MAMKPILFNTDMVRSILDGRKTVMRRVVKYTANAIYDAACVKGRWHEIYDPKNPPESLVQWYVKHIAKPPYKSGDILYVRETWTEELGRYYYRADFESDYLDACETLSGGYPEACAYHPGCDGCTRESQRIYWRPSIHMPKKAARIFLRVTNVRVERLQEITNEEIKREGVLPSWTTPWLTEGKRRLPKFGTDIHGQPYCCASHVGHCMEEACPNRQAHDRECHADPFIEVWDSTIKPSERDKYGWEANPYVWVISIERISKDEAMQ